jgi:hypothetical protein
MYYALFLVVSIVICIIVGVPITLIYKFDDSEVEQLSKVMTFIINAIVVSLALAYWNPLGITFG